MHLSRQSTALWFDAGNRMGFDGQLVMSVANACGQRVSAVVAAVAAHARCITAR